MDTKKPSKSCTSTNAECAQVGRVSPQNRILVQIRCGSQVADWTISERIEHPYSGTSEPLKFLSRYIEDTGCATAN